MRSSSSRHQDMSLEARKRGPSLRLRADGPAELGSLPTNSGPATPPRQSAGQWPRVTARLLDGLLSRCVLRPVLAAV